MSQYNLQRMLLFAVLATFAKNSFAAIENNFSVGLGTEWNSNVFETEFAQQSDTIARILINLNLASSEEHFDYGISYDLLREEYLDNSFDSRNYYNGLAFINFTLIPSRLSWTNEIGSSVTLREANGTDLPNNRDQRNSYSTALDYSIVNNSKNTVTASLTFNRFEFREANENGSDRALFAIDWTRAISKYLQAGIACDSENVEFEVGSSYDAFACGLHATRKINNGAIVATIGSKTIDANGLSDSETDLVYSVRADWASGPNSLRIQSTKDLVDTSVGLFKHKFDSDPNVAIDQNTDNIDISLRTRTQATYIYTFSQVSDIRTTFYVDEDQRFSTEQNNDRKGAQVRYNSRLTPTLDFGFEYDYEYKQVASGTPQSELTRTNRYTLVLEKTLSQHLQMSGRIRSESLSSDIEGNDYDLYAVLVDVVYNF